MGECLLGSRVQVEGHPTCLSTFPNRMTDEWVFNMVGFCDGHSGNLCTRLVENRPPWACSLRVSPCLNMSIFVHPGASRRTAAAVSTRCSDSATASRVGLSQSRR